MRLTGCTHCTVNKVPLSEQRYMTALEYPAKKAARKFLKAGKALGVTKAARRLLKAAR